MLSVGSVKSLNSFFPMPFGHHARITVTNEGAQPIGDLYYNIDYRTYAHPLPPGTLYFHAQYRQAQPNHGWTTDWTATATRWWTTSPTSTGDDNYVWMEAKGHGQFVGVTMSVLQNQDMWWGEGDDMFFIDGEKTPSITGTGTEDYFLGAWDFGGEPFSYPLIWSAGGRRRTGRQPLQRLPLPSRLADSIQQILQGDHRAWPRQRPVGQFLFRRLLVPGRSRMQPFPPLPPVEERLPTLQPVGGPGNSTAAR